MHLKQINNDLIRKERNSMLGMTQMMEALANKDAENHDITLEALENLDDSVFEAVEGVEDEEDYDDSVENDMAGRGVGSDDEDKYEQLLKDIPEDDEDMDDRIDEVTEGFIVY